MTSPRLPRDARWRKCREDHAGQADNRASGAQPLCRRRPHGAASRWGVLAGLTPPDVECALVDDRMESIDFDARSDLAAITVETFTSAAGLRDRRRFPPARRAGALGGIHVTLRPDEAAQHADALVIGDAEAVWRQVVDDARHGRLKPRYVGPRSVAQPGECCPGATCIGQGVSADCAGAIHAGLLLRVPVLRGEPLFRPAATTSAGSTR